jgi:hypothetical protein
MLIFDDLSGRVNSPSLLSVLDLITPRYPTCSTEFLRIDFHRTNYGIHEPMSSACQFNEVIGLFDFGLTRDEFLKWYQYCVTLQTFEPAHNELTLHANNSGWNPSLVI